MWHYASSGRPSDEPYCPWPRIFVSVLAVHAPSTLPIQRSWDCQLMRGLPPKCPCTEHWCPDRGMGASAMVHTSSGAQGESPTVMETCNQVGKGKKPYERDRPVPAVADGAQGAAPTGHPDTPKKGGTCVGTQSLQRQQRGCVILVRLGCDIVIATPKCGVLLGDEHLAGVSFGIVTMYLLIFRAK